jgi:hypothetical protein
MGTKNKTRVAKLLEELASCGERVVADREVTMEELKKIIIKVSSLDCAELASIYYVAMFMLAIMATVQVRRESGISRAVVSAIGIIDVIFKAMSPDSTLTAQEAQRTLASSVRYVVEHPVIQEDEVRDYVMTRWNEEDMPLC